VQQHTTQVSTTECLGEAAREERRRSDGQAAGRYAQTIFDSMRTQTIFDSMRTQTIFDSIFDSMRRPYSKPAVPVTKYQEDGCWRQPPSAKDAYGALRADGKDLILLEELAAVDPFLPLVLLGSSCRASKISKSTHTPTTTAHTTLARLLALASRTRKPVSVAHNGLLLPLASTASPPQTPNSANIPIYISIWPSAPSLPEPMKC